MTLLSVRMDSKRDGRAIVREGKEYRKKQKSR
jgi:hypothetical protein